MRLAAALIATLGLSPAAHAVDVTVIGLFPNKAVVTINRGAPRTLAVGQKTPEGVALVASDATGAVLEIDGKRQRLEMGQHFESAESTGARNSATLAADERGHFIVDGGVNGRHVRFLVDTGATLVALPAADARRLGIDYRKGDRGVSHTANGQAVVYRVTLESVTVGDVTLRNVEGVIHESAGLGIALLGMSFLNRTEMRREGPNLTLTKRY